MSFDSMAMAAVAAELDAMAGAQVQQVHQPEAETVVLTLRAGGRIRRLLLSAHARYARVHLLAPRHQSSVISDPSSVTDHQSEEAEAVGADRRVRPGAVAAAGHASRPTPHAPTHHSPLTTHSGSAPPHSGTTPPAFCMLLRKYLKGAFLHRVEQVDFDRVLHLTFRFGEAEVVLVAEVMGKHSNVILVNAEGTVLDAIKRIGPRESRARLVQPGIPYAPPPTPARKSPAEATPEMVRALLDEDASAPVGQGLRGHFHIGPSVLEIVLRRCGVGEETPAREADAACLADSLRVVANPAGYAPALVRDARGVPVGVSFLPLPPTAPPRAGGPGGASPSELLDAYYTYLIAHEAVETRRRTWLRQLADTVRYAERRIREAEEGTEASRSAPDLEREGTLLISNLNRIPRGAASATVVNFYDPEQREVTIPLDPTMPAREQAEKRFKRARKLLDAVPHLERQWEEEQQRLESLRALRPQVEAATSLEDLDALAPALRDLGVFRERPAQTPGARAAADAGAQHRSIGGFEVLMGRNATENDTLTRRVADPDDIWLHARGITSAHVVIRTGKHPEKVPQSVLMEAAKMCALHSQAKHSHIVPVDYTLRKYVVKRRGSAPGSVQYTHEKTLHVEPGL